MAKRGPTPTLSTAAAAGIKRLVDLGYGHRSLARKLEPPCHPEVVMDLLLAYDDLGFTRSEAIKIVQGFQNGTYKANYNTVNMIANQKYNHFMDDPEYVERFIR